MRTSNLAECLEEFAATLSVIDQPEPEANAPRILTAVARTARQSPRRLSLTMRRIQIRDQGLHQFKVF